MTKKYKPGDRVFHERIDHSIATAIVQDVEEESYIDDKGREIPYQMLIFDKGDHWSICTESYNCLSPNNPRCKHLVKQYEQFDNQKDKIISSIMEIMSPFGKSIQKEILELLRLKIK